MRKADFNRPLARMFRTAKLIDTGEYVALTAFIPACPDFGHVDFYWIKTIPGEEISVTPEELTEFVL